MQRPEWIFGAIFGLGAAFGACQGASKPSQDGGCGRATLEGGTSPTFSFDELFEDCTSTRDCGAGQQCILYPPQVTFGAPFGGHLAKCLIPCNRDSDCPPEWECHVDVRDGPPRLCWPSPSYRGPLPTARPQPHAHRFWVPRWVSGPVGLERRSPSKIAP